MPNIPYTPPYAATGPWSNGVAPGISAAALNEIEGWIQQVDNSPAVTINGSTSGTASLYQPLTGIAKIVIVTLTNFRNGNAGDQVLTIPVPFTNWSVGFSFGSGPFHLNKAGSAATISQLSSLPSSSGGQGGVVTGTAGGNNNNVFGTPSIDAVGLYGSQSVAYTGFIALFGQ